MAKSSAKIFRMTQTSIFVSLPHFPPRYLSQRKRFVCKFIAIHFACFLWQTFWSCLFLNCLLMILLGFEGDKIHKTFLHLISSKIRGPFERLRSRIKFWNVNDIDSSQSFFSLAQLHFITSIKCWIYAIRRLAIVNFIASAHNVQCLSLEIDFTPSKEKVSFIVIKRKSALIKRSKFFYSYFFLFEVVIYSFRIRQGFNEFKPLKLEEKSTTNDLIFES